MTPRSAAALAGLVVLVAGLAVYRESRREGPGPAPGSPSAAAPAPAPAAAPAPAPLPRVLDFGRDT